ncbi:MAG: signal peptidase I [Clostridia bacterium]|nr:signal peptidase I [Clostridia bacterium]
MKFLFLKGKNETPENTDGFQVNSEFAENLPEEKVIEEPKSAAKEVFDWLDVLSIAVISVVVIFSLLFRIATISGPSMQNTLHSGERVIISNFAYTPKNGDIVVVSRNIENSLESQDSSDGPIIKRVIAVGGQTVNIDFEKGEVSVDGKVLKEDYISTPTTTKWEVDFPVYVPEGCIFVLGDNRQNSLDSRSVHIGKDGIIDNRYVLGHAVYRIFPFNKIGKLD